MLTTQILSGLCILAVVAVLATSSAGAKAGSEELVQIAELDIDPAQLDAYKDALKQEISTAIAVEPGVLALYAVAIKDHPNQIRLFERYADHAAYESHVQSVHFKKYKTDTQNMVSSLKLIETSPILLGGKADQH